jgi:YtkA-like protein
MLKRSNVFAAAALFVVASFAQAGGLATIRVARLPETLSAGKPTWVTFTVHDVAGKPINNLKPVVIATRGDQRVSIRASRVKQEGGYQARLAFPAAGEWTLTVDSKYCHNTAVLRDIEVGAAN